MKRSIGILMSLVILIILSFFLTAKNTLLDQDASQDKKPNVIVILADDAGYADFGFMGSEDIRTPNLDALVADGVLFKDAHVSASVCSPSRAGLLTGQYQQRFGHECNLEPDQSGAFDHKQITIAEALNEHGYSTSIFGKWHLGEEQHQHPLQNGFDYFWGFLAGGRSYFQDSVQDQIGNTRAILENNDPSSFDGYLTDAIGNKAVEYIEKMPEEAPFFMYLSFNAPHTPMHAKQEVVAMFGEEHERPVYAAMLWSMDEAIGKVINSLKQKGMYENTLIFFLSDNGGAHNNGSSVFPFKGWKGNQYEGGTRVPFSLTWKKRIEGGQTFDGLTSSLDIFATALAAGSLYKPDLSRLDGVDLMPYLENNEGVSPHDVLFWRKDEMATIRTEQYKLITLYDSLHVVYDLKNDLNESYDLKHLRPGLRDSLKLALDNWQNNMINPLWIEPEDWNRVTREIYQDLMNNRDTDVKDPGDLWKLSANRDDAK